MLFSDWLKLKTHKNKSSRYLLLTEQTFRNAGKLGLNHSSVVGKEKMAIVQNN